MDTIRPRLHPDEWRCLHKTGTPQKGGSPIGASKTPAADWLARFRPYVKDSMLKYEREEDEEGLEEEYPGELEKEEPVPEEVTSLEEMVALEHEEDEEEELRLEEK